jgi:ABC-type bacteriocin/lantibiotic exporter with double-glycine peptidase domain
MRAVSMAERAMCRMVIWSGVCIVSSDSPFMGRFESMPMQAMDFDVGQPPRSGYYRSPGSCVDEWRVAVNAERGGWWSPPVDDLSGSFARGGMPPTLLGFVFRVSASSQVWLSLLAIAVFALNTAPLELQRRILNTIVHDRDMKLVLGLAVAYAGIVLSEGLVKLLMNVYRGWVSEKAVRALRLAATAVANARPGRRNEANIQGIEISLILAEPEPIGAFVGVAVSEPIVQAGILVSVIGYMLYIEPQLAAVSIAILWPQFVFVPLMQRAINRRVQSRIVVLRETSIGVLPNQVDEMETALRQEMRFSEIFVLNLGIMKLKYSMNFLMNITQNAAKIVVLAVGGWLVINGRTEVGTLVAFISGLRNLNDPWGDLVNWFQDMMVNRAKYSIFVAAMKRFASGSPKP